MNARAVTLLSLSCLAAPGASAQMTGDGRARPAASTVRVTAPPVIDGRLDDSAWREVAAIAEFVQREPVEGAAPSEPTVVRLVYDGEALYVGVWLYDSDPAGIVQGETRRDASLDNTDAFLILLDTYHDGQNGFVFGTNPAGIEYDGQVTREGTGESNTRVRQQTGTGGGFNLNWDGSWTVATSRDTAGWYAEFRLPFSTLRYQRGGLQTWGLNLARHIRRRNEQVFWAPIPRQYNLYRVSEAGMLEGIDAPARRSVTLTPYALGSVRRDSLPGADSEGRGEVGADAKVVLTPSLTLDLTYNTDFAQVEVDEAQVNLTRFSLFFPEKRPFFLENAGLFAVGMPQSVEMFFSRRIGLDTARNLVPIVGGGRVTGRAAGFLVGLLDIQTDAVPGVTPPNNYAVVRVLRELPNRSRLGAIVVNRVATDRRGDYNRTYAVDGRLGLGDALLVDAYAATTETPGLGGHRHAYNLAADYLTRNWEASATYTEVGDHFNPEVGFLEREGYRFVHGFVLRHLRFPSVAWLRELRPHVSYRGWFDFDGFNESQNIHFDCHLELANGAFFSPAVNLTREGLKAPFEIAEGVFVQPGSYDNVEAAWRFNTNESARLSLNGELNWGGFFSGIRRGFVATATARAGATVAASLRVEYNDVALKEGSFETTLVGLRAAYAFTPRIYLQSLVQYSSQEERWSGNVRFGWLSTAGTGLFVVYNEEQGTDDRRGLLGRAVIVKFTRQLAITS